MNLYLTTVVVCVLVVVALLYLLRTRRIREKYAGVWILLTLAVVVVGAFPQLAFWLSGLVGVQTPVNLVFSLAILVLLGVCIQLSTEVSHLEEETRTLAEEIALLRLEVRQQHPGGPGVPGPDARTGAEAVDEPASPAGPASPTTDEAP